MGGIRGIIICKNGTFCVYTRQAKIWAIAAMLLPLRSLFRNLEPIAQTDASFAIFLLSGNSESEKNARMCLNFE